MPFYHSLIAGWAKKYKIESYTQCMYSISFYSSLCVSLSVSVSFSHLLLLLLFFETEFLCSTALIFSETCFIDQAGLELTEIYLPLPPKCWDQRCVPPLPSLLSLSFNIQKFCLCDIKCSYLELLFITGSLKC